ncbi:BOI-related E3 ubiquitin-protein ligase 1-like [Momordica charantia]|uniref:BOI-related E3 ubiquitin-protein ligase 1-like n=1 Tax=Momordica charantia TaxID=3673 RepID=A0A6J1CLU6_MOMCH|nr:BOI-related E3 ubiquitin-protein ligase 1-like [Momordica charantia]
MLSLSLCFLSQQKQRKRICSIFMAVEARRMNLLPSPFTTSRDFTKPNEGEAESGVTCNFPARKRPRRPVYDEPAAARPVSGFFDEQILHHHYSEMDRFIAIHTEKVRMEMEERKRRQCWMLVSAIEERVVRKVKEKEEEIARMGKLNWVLEERVKQLCRENQLWRDLAETNQAAVNSLRTNLDHLLHIAAAGRDRDQEQDDAQSSCATSPTDDRRSCRKCAAGDSTVLVLPCRHLCLCTMCGSTLHTCPLCNSAINATIHVNFS